MRVYSLGEEDIGEVATSHVSAGKPEGTADLTSDDDDGYGGIFQLLSEDLHNRGEDREAALSVLSKASQAGQNVAARVAGIGNARPSTQIVAFSTWRDSAPARTLGDGIMP